MSSRVPVTAASLIIASVFLLWPAFHNTQPFFFPDTTAYVRGADAAIAKLTGMSTDWTRQLETDNSGTGGGAAVMVPDKSVLAGRSIYYGALVYLGDRAGGGWLTIALQALLVVAVLYGTMQSASVGRRPYLLVLVGLLAVLTTLPLYASFLMPDVFAGITVLACAVLLTSDLRRHWVRNAAWFAVLTLSLTFHTTHAILALLFLGVGVLLLMARRALVVPRGVATIAAAVGIAYLCSAAFTFGVTKLMGQPPLTPPFLMARLIEDGPGYDYLKDTCPQNGFGACRFVTRLPVQSDDFLWSKDPRIGVFNASDPVTRRALSKEQFRFALAVVAHEPMTQILASLRNAGEQLGLVRATEFTYTPEDKATFAKKVPASYFEVMKTTPAYRGTTRYVPLSVLSYVSTAAGLICVVSFLASRAYRKARRPQQLRVLMSLILVGVFANAAVCGAISGPHDRYQARIAWLLPAMALIASFQIHRQWWHQRLKMSDTPD